MSKRLRLSNTLDLPLAAVTQTFAFLARRGAGKTYAASKLCEEMLTAGAQVVVLDPVGTWYGLRLLASGKKSTFEIPVFGGLHGDLPLEPGAGKIVADLVVDRGISVVLDVAAMRKGDRKHFAVDFAEQLFHRKKSSRTPIHLFVEEAQTFVPQRVSGAEARMLGAFEDIIKLGRNFGIGASLISQRPQSVNKDALNQTECLVVGQTNGSQERKAIENWIVDQGLDSKELVDTLPSLEPGEFWIWSPSWLRVIERVKIAKKRTYDASATPEIGSAESAEPASLSASDLEQIRADMADVVAKAEADDPKKLRKRIIELERELTKAEKAKPETKIEEVVVPVIKEEELNRLQQILSEYQQATTAIAQTVADALRFVDRPRPRPGPPPPDVVPGTKLKPKPTAQDADVTLGKGERAILTVLAQYPEGKTKRAIGTLAGYSSRGGSFGTYLSRLRTKGLIEGTDPVQITDAGFSALGDFEPLPTGQALVDHWKQKLGKGERAILEVLLEHWPAEVDRHELGTLAGYEPTGGSFGTYLSRLRTKELIEPDRLKASDAFFEVTS